VIFMNFFCTSGGSGAAPEMQNFIDERLYFAICGCATSTVYIVGTPQKIVILCCSIVFRTSVGWNLGSRTMVPAMWMAAFIDVVIP